MHLKALVAESLTHTWFAVEGAEAVACARRGSRPGGPLADAIFNIAFAPALREVEETMFREGLAWTPAPAPAVFRVQEERPITHSVFADDAAFCAVVRDNEQAVHEATKLCDVIYECFTRRGMRINWSRGKTGLLLAACGRGARRLRQEVHVTRKSILPLRGGPSVFVDASYVHLGGVVASGGGMGRELAARRQAHSSALGQLRRSVFRQQGVGDHVRMTIGHALASSRLFFCSAVWGPLSKAQLRDLDAQAPQLLRAASRMPHKDPRRTRRTDCEVLEAAKKLDVAGHIRFQRLRYLPRLLKHGDGGLLTFCDFLWLRNAHWAALLREDFAALSKYCPDAPREEAEWFAMARTDPNEWRRRVNTAEARFRGDFLDTLRRRTWRRELDLICGAAGRPPPPGGFHTGDAMAGFVCYECGTVLASKAAWATHRRRLHDHVPLASRFAWGSACAVCTTEFHTRPRLIWHLRVSRPRCLAALSQFFEPMDLAHMLHLDAKDRASAQELRMQGLYDRAAVLPAVRLSGPALKEWDGPVDPAVLAPAAPEDRREGTMAAAPHRFREPVMYYILHLFSGQRRPLDFQDACERRLQGALPSEGP